MPNTGFFRASSVEVSGGTNTTGTDNLILDGEGQFNTDIVGGDPTSDPLAVTLNFTDFFIPEGNRITGIEFILEGQINTGNFVNVLAPTIRAGTPGNLIALPTPGDVTLVGSSGLLGGSLSTEYLPTNHTYTMDSIYATINDPDLPATTVNPTIDNANAINQIVGDTPDRVVTLEITLDALTLGVNTLTLVGANGVSQTGDDVGIGLDTSLLPAIRIFYEQVPSSVKITNSTKVLLRGIDPNTPTDSGIRGAVTLVNSDGVTGANSLLNGETNNASFNPDGFVILSDFFTSSNPEGEFIIPEEASNIQVTVRVIGFNSGDGDVRLKYSFASTGNEAITIVGNPTPVNLPNGFRGHTDILTNGGFTPSFWNNFTQILIQLNDDYPFASNYFVLGNVDQNDPSLQLTYNIVNPKVTIK